ncbi:LacI family transcriptional regulator [Pedobacter sp. HMWF019]|uniref:LacI family DNA-binding transcriptional regulator n=1 Tax=Pedobacter sp. HMWF019 TaxID=2056856 RepID=UPI000D34C916|nr:LacI family DNA-binding transcriptional regulator [Pedobacter sp. HMWF019]PTT01710.1 LacI family transcriptional regulator [Pedobacter sp. HMWF019]
MFEPSTLKDIAKALGLSTSTVSRALRDTHEISPETKKIVLEYAEKINYRPNPIALSLKERRSKSIGVIVSEVANHYFSQAINGIESIAYSRGYHVIITQTHESYEREKANIQHLASRSVDGLLVSLSAETSDTSYLQSLHKRGLPMVFFDRVADDIETHKIIANNEKGAFEATEYLIKKGCKRIAHLTSSAHLSISIERLEGYKQALEKYGLPFNQDYVKYCPHGGMFYEETETAVKELMALEEKPDAIFIAGDRLSIGCLVVLKNLKINIPEDINVTGFSNSDVLDLFNPPLTSVRQPAFEMGQIATEKLIKLIESKYPVYEFEKEVLETSLQVRDDL